MDRKVSNKKVTIKNYMIVICLFIATGIIIITLAGYYKDYREYYRSIPVINGYLNEISEGELDNYLTENNDTFIYICKADDNDCRKLEKNLKGFVKEHNLIDKAIYINLFKVKNKQNFINKINTNYKGSKTVNNYPAFIIIKNRKVLDLVSGNITVDDIKELLDNNGVLGD